MCVTDGTRTEKALQGFIDSDEATGCFFCICSGMVSGKAEEENG